jgi:hypothetical protein
MESNACRRRSGVGGRDLAEIVAAIHAAGRGVAGPWRLDNRYVLEDVPFGLVVIEAVARVSTPHTSAAIAGGRAACAPDAVAARRSLPQRHVGFEDARGSPGRSPGRGASRRCRDA